MKNVTVRRMVLGSLVLGSGLMTVGAGRTMAAQAVKAEAPASNSEKAYGPTYRLTYTLSEMDGEKKAAVQRFAMTLNPPDRGSIKVGSKIPVVTGTIDAGSGKADTQFTYLDVGINIDAALMQFSNGMRLMTKVERSSVAGAADVTSEDVQQPLPAIHEPVVRQSVLQNTALLVPGKAVVLGSLTMPSSTRRVDVEVLLELVR